MSAALPAQSKTDQSKIHQKRWKVEEVCAMKWTARSQQLFHRFRTEEFGTCPQVCAAVAASRLLRFVLQLQGTNLWKERRAPGPSSLASLWPLLTGSILSSVGENGTELMWADSVSDQQLSLCLSHGVNQLIAVGLGDSHGCFCVWIKHLHWVRPWTFLLDVWQWLYRGLNGIHADLSCMGTLQQIATCVGSILARRTMVSQNATFRYFSFCCGKTVESVSHKFMAWTFNSRIVRRTVPRVDVSVSSFHQISLRGQSGGQTWKGTHVDSSLSFQLNKTLCLTLCNP